MTSHLPRAVAWAAGALLLAWLPAQAQQILSTSKHDTSLPLAITADAMHVEQNAQTATFTGAVEVVQGDMQLNSDKLTVFYRDQQAAAQNAIYKIDVDGNVHFATPTETASGDTGTYDVDKGVDRAARQRRADQRRERDSGQRRHHGPEYRAESGVRGAR